MKRITTVLISLICASALYAQTGATCSNPYVISALPYSQTGLTTAGFPNTYTSANACTSSYMSGNDNVFSFVAPSNMLVTVILTGTGPGTGVFVTQECPDSPTAVCIAEREEIGGNPIIPSASLIAGNTYYIIVSTYNYAGMNPSTAYSIEVRQVYNTDAASLMLFQPRTRCDLMASDTIIALIKNQGVNDIPSMSLGYSINGQTPVIENYWPGTLAAGSEAYYRFVTLANLSSPGLKDIKIFTIVPGDENNANDTISFPVWNEESVSTYPYTADFETSDNNWVSQWMIQLRPGSSWERGVPASPVIDHAASGTQCFKTNLGGNTLMPEESYIQGPCFDFSALTSPVFEMDLWFETGTADIVYVDYSIDSVDHYIHWQRLGAYQSGLNWYNIPSTTNPGWRGNSGDWIHVRQACDSLGGISRVLFRIVYQGSFQTSCEGVAVDNIRISESPLNDLSVIQLLNPVSSCGIGSDSITVKVTNRGLNAQVNPEIRYSINNGQTWISENMTQTLNFQDTVTFTFTQNADMTTPGLYPVIVKTALTGDQFPVNDSVFVNIMNWPDLTAPYSNDFETDNGNWLPEGMNCSWEYGTPSEATMDHAASGTKAWVTNLDGNSSDLELSTLTSPCIDLSGMQNPHIKLKIWSEITLPGYCQIQYKETSGINWAVIGSDNDPFWYNSGYSWNQSSGNWSAMEHDLAGLPSPLQLRLNFQSPIPSPGFGFDDFVICDGPEANFEQLIPTKSLSICVHNLSLNYDSVHWSTSDGQLSSLTDVVCFTGYTNPSDLITVTCIAYNECTTDTFSLVLSPVDGIEESIASSFRVFPNPFSEKIIIDSDIAFEKWELNDITGRVIITGNNNNSIDTRNLNKGSYLLRIYTEKGIVVNKPVVKN